MGRLVAALRLQRRARRAERATPERRAELRSEQLARLVAHARRHSPLYAERLRELPERVDDPRLLPPVTKAELMDDFDGWTTDPAVRMGSVRPFLGDPDRVGEPFLGRYRVMKSSGTTGDPAILVHDRSSIAVARTLWRQRAVPGRWISVRDGIDFLRRGVRVAQVLPRGAPLASVVFSRALHSESPVKARTISVFDDIPGQVRALEAFDPTALIGYATSLLLLAREREAGRLFVNPRLVVSTGERMDPQTRSEIEGVFGTPVRDAYAAAEHGALAFDCEHGALHLNDDRVIFEPVDERYEPVEPGEPAQNVLLTNLANWVQPLIRYVLTDSVRIDPERCPCGRSLPVVRVASRRRQVFWLQGEDGGRVPVPPIVLAGVLGMIDGVGRYQVIQKTEDRLIVRLEVGENDDRERVWRSFRDRLAGYLERQGVTGASIELDSTPPRRDPLSGKYLMFWSELEADPG